ncbi:MAG: glycosyltransferase [Patescibacteria group bacterium]|jgi:glycosyltransferase involved in cell wall biosynthesis
MWPKVTIVTPALNAASVLELELKSILDQDYPREKIEIIVGDGGSSDRTVQIAKKYGAKVVSNPLRTGESGKMAAFRYATGEYTALIDTDNILPSSSWLKEMIKPLMENPEAVGSEPWSYTWRKMDGFITRYCALIGMNDPLVSFLGNYDRMNTLTRKWTEIPHNERDMGNYILVTFDKRGVPTVGANGSVFRTAFLRDNVKGDYLFDIDVVSDYVSKRGSATYIKVKNGIVHTYCERSISKFVSKQRRRVVDFLYHQQSTKKRVYDWYSMDIVGKKSRGMFEFVLSCLTLFPLIIQSVKGYLRKNDIAWFFHPLACEITLWVYAWHRIFSFLNNSEYSRDNWKQ